MTQKANNLWGSLILAIAGIGYGLMAPLVRYSNSVVQPFTSITIRYGLVTIFLLIILILRRDLRSLRPVSLRDGVLLVAVGLIGAGLSNILFSLSVLSTSIGEAVFLFSLYAVFTPVIAGLILNEWPKLGQWIALFIAVIGMLLLTKVNLSHDLRIISIGNLLAIGGALFVSIQYAGTRAVRAHNAISIAFYLSFGSVAVAFPIALLTELTKSIPSLYVVHVSQNSYVSAPLGWIALIAFAGINMTVNLLVSQGFRMVKASFGGILLLLEPVVALLIGIFFFSESQVLSALVGALLILAGGAISVWIEGRKSI